MPQGRYERYGLTANPFRDLSADSLPDPEVYHVNLAVDQTLRAIKEETLEKANKALVALSGLNGTGKTERLRVAEAEARERGALSVYFSIGAKPEGLIAALAKQLLSCIKLEGFLQALSPPKWYRDLNALARRKGKSVSGGGAGKVFAEALSAKAPAFLLINDLHNIGGTPEEDPFLVALQEAADALQPGVLILFGSYPKFLSETLNKRPALTARVNRILLLPSMDRDEAGLMVAKKLLPKRLVEQLDPLYPFDDAAVDVVVQRAGGNPRRVLQMADKAMEYAVERRAYRVDAQIAGSALPESDATVSRLAPKKASPKPTGLTAGMPTPPLPRTFGK